MKRELQLDYIETSIQCRHRIDPATVEDYATDMKNGSLPKFPELVVFSPRGSDRYILADGHHRWHAAKAAGLKVFKCDVRIGDEHEALHYALSANAENGLRRTSADKRKAVLMALNEPAFDKLSLRDMGELCRVSHATVRNIKEEINEKAAEIKNGKAGTTKKARKLANKNKPKAPPDQSEIDLLEFRDALSIVKGFPYSGKDATFAKLMNAADKKALKFATEWMAELWATVSD
jgi:hypothetical protein